MINRARWRWSANTVTRFGLPLALVALSVVFALWWWWGLIVTLPLVAIAVWDFFQDEHTLRRNYPLLARVRWIMEDLRPFARAYVVEGDLDGRPFNHDERALVYARAKGELDSHPFGTELDVYSDEYEWLAHSIVPNEAAPTEWRCRRFQWSSMTGCPRYSVRFKVMVSPLLTLRL